MKMKMNKACDLSSISVLPPPQARRSNVANTGAESSIFGRSQAASQLRSQQLSQQSFSQGVSSQPNMFSQLTQNQNSPDDIAINDQRFGSQERDTSTKRLSSLPPINNTREESQNQISRSSTNFLRKWHAPEQRNQINEELEYRIGMMETSLSRFGMILDSIQSDIMQVNKGRKELALEMESIRQKLNVSDNTLQLMNKGQDDVKVNLDRAVSTICDQLGQYAYQESSHDMITLLTDLPEKIELCVQKLKNDICKSFSKEMQGISCSQQILNQKLISAVHLSKDVNHHVTPPEGPSNKRLVGPNNVLSSSVQASQIKVQKETAAVKIEMGTWNSVKSRQPTFTDRNSVNARKQRGTLPTELERIPRINIESDEEISRDFCYFLDDKETGTGNFSMQEAQEETERILRKARRRKRKHSNTIFIS
ncbi:Recombination initiation defects 3 [Heracleum sosnowskyi]|uniref:Recombination initiation defects 3 n=1 Tax=Heracleum sosnowskyi TaxID=360622 RepID=A0AAD8I033_9APIA|nr:Recombination initiation defects 3 [Heracleum sosnowskyi]